jgi:DNA polymerase-3 subunit epsilon
VQRSYHDPTTPLHRVTFCVLDLETTGGSPHADAITEIGAVKVRGGEIIGTFQTLVNPGLSVPGPVTVLTGITDTMLAPAPPVHEVLPALSEFVGGAVLVGHNVRFDASFLDAALVAHGRPVLGIHRVDTAALARRLLRNDDDVLNCKLGTLAVRYGLDHDPCHRALDDALATVDLLHLLLERAAAFGVSALDDLLTLPSMAGHPHAHKLRLTSRLPRQPGVYLFRDRQGRPLHLGRATDLRTRVRSLFASDDGRTIRPLLRTAHSLDHVVCSSALEAGVLEASVQEGHPKRVCRKGFRRQHAGRSLLPPPHSATRLALSPLVWQA